MVSDLSLHKEAERNAFVNICVVIQSRNLQSFYTSKNSDPPLFVNHNDMIL